MIERSSRHERVAAGLAELERWLADQVRHGLAAASAAQWEELSRRLVDAQAPGVAGAVSRLAGVRALADWPGALLGEYALLNLLAVAYRRLDALPSGLAASVLTRVGFTTARDLVLSGTAVRDRWDVLGSRDEQQDHLTARRVWLRGRSSRRMALVLSFAPPSQPLDDSLVPGTVVDAALAFYPAAAPLRALVADPGEPAADGVGGEPKRGAAVGVPVGMSVDEGLDEVARVLAADPWVESWPLLLRDVTPGRTTLDGLPWREPDPWRLLAVSGGAPLTVAAEWTPRGLRPLSTWDHHGRAVVL